MSRVELISPEGLRIDGRRQTEMRNYFARIGTIGQADGSAYLEMGHTKVLAACYGPKEVRNLNIDYIVIA